MQGGEVPIRHHGRVATTPRGERAVTFRLAVECEEPQELMARVYTQQVRSWFPPNADPGICRGVSCTGTVHDTGPDE